MQNLIEYINIAVFGKEVAVTDFNQSSAEDKFTELVLSIYFFNQFSRKDMFYSY